MVVLVDGLYWIGFFTVPRHFAVFYAIDGRNSHALFKFSIPFRLVNSSFLKKIDYHHLCRWHPDVNLKLVQWIPKGFRSTPFVYYAFSTVITLLYLNFPSCTLFFQVSYGAMILLLSLSLHFYAQQIPSGTMVKVLLQRSAIFIISAFILWNMDNLMCDKLRRLRTDFLPTFLGPMFQFHAWWHVLSMISGVHSLVAVLMAWCKTNPERLSKEMVLWKLDTHFNGILPWIHFKKLIIKKSI